MGKNLFQRGFTGYQQIVIFRVRNADGPKFELAGTFFTGYVEDSFVGKPQHRLEYQSRFSDARFSSNQGELTLHQSPSQYTVQLFVEHVHALFFI